MNPSPRCFISRDNFHMDSSWINIHLNSTFTYDIWLGDPGFFLLSYNPGGPPNSWKKAMKEILIMSFSVELLVMSCPM